jgi:hypothetical protein
MRLPNLPARRLVLACGLAALLAPLVAADDKKDEKPALAGTWKKAEGEMVIEFVDKETLKVRPHGDKADIAIECSYSVGKGGVVKAKITGHEGKDEFKKKLKEVAAVDTEFTFKWAVDGDKVTIEEVDGKNADGLKTHLEGKYEKK